MEQTGAERRQFERRAGLLQAYAVLPGRLRIACIVENLSEGGALLTFTEGAAPTQSFRLVIAGTDFNLLCETLHRAGRKLGVRFVNVADAQSLSAYVASLPEDAQRSDVGLSLGTSRPTASSVRDLRRSVLGIGASAPAPAQGKAEEAA